MPRETDGPGGIAVKPVDPRDERLFTERIDGRLILRRRPFHRRSALLIAFFWAPVAIPGFVAIAALVVMTPHTVPDGPTLAVLALEALALCYGMLVVPLRAIVSLWRVPMKALFDDAAVTVYPHPLHPTTAIEIPYEEITRIAWDVELRQGGFRGVGFVDRTRALVIESAGRRLVLHRLRTSVVPPSLEAVLREIIDFLPEGHRARIAAPRPSAPTETSPRRSLWG